MAGGADTARIGGSRYVIYVRPSRGLVAQSWSWPERWHTAFEEACAQLGCAAAFCILAGLPVTGRSILEQVSIAGVAFSVRRRGARIYISVSEFTGPTTPGPDGARPQPHPALGLALGLRGSGKSFRVVVFQGHMPSIPATNVLSKFNASGNRYYWANHYCKSSIAIRQITVIDQTMFSDGLDIPKTSPVFGKASLVETVVPDSRNPWSHGPRVDGVTGAARLGEMGLNFREPCHAAPDCRSTRIDGEHARHLH
jgi:hypothetical protein